MYKYSTSVELLCFASKVHMYMQCPFNDQITLQLYVSIELSDLMHLMVLSSELPIYVAFVRNIVSLTTLTLQSQEKGVYMVTMCTMS